MTEQQIAASIPPKQRRRANKGRKRHKPTNTVSTKPKANNPTDNPLGALSTAKQASTTGLDKARIVRLLLAGMPKQKIAQKCNVSLTHCNNLIKEIDKEIETLGWKDYLSVLLSKLRLILDNHSQLGADIQELMLDCDMSIKDTQAAIDSDSDKDQRLRLIVHIASLRAHRLTLMRELNANNLALTTNLSKMGVTTRPPSSENKVPTQSSIATGFTELGEVPIGYEKMNKDQLVEGLAESNRAVNRLLRAERDKKRGSESG